MSNAWAYTDDEACVMLGISGQHDAANRIRHKNKTIESQAADIKRLREALEVLSVRENYSILERLQPDHSSYDPPIQSIHLNCRDHPAAFAREALGIGGKG